jgi:hypothetical protein
MSCTWRDAYVAAILETDVSKMFARIADALIVIEDRLESAVGMGISERLAMECARQELRSMEADRVVGGVQRTSRFIEARVSRLVH